MTHQIFQLIGMDSAWFQAGPTKYLIPLLLHALQKLTGP